MWLPDSGADMPKVRIAQTNFSAGEFTDMLAARSDVTLYKNGASKLENFRLHYQGGASARYGTQYQATFGFADPKLAPFVFNESQYYWLAFTDTRCEIYESTGRLAATLTGAPWSSSEAAPGKRLNWAQQADTMIVVHPDFAMQIIKRTGSTQFTRSAYAFEALASTTGSTGIIYQPYFKFVDSTITMQPAVTAIGTTGVFTFSSSAAIGTSTGYIGANIRYKGKQIRVTASTGPTTLQGYPLETLPSTAADTDWDEAVFSAYRGYANSVCWFGDRLVFGGSKSHPFGIWLSKVGAYFNFDLGTAQASEAIWESAPATLISEIRHLLDFRHLLVYGDRSFAYVPSAPDTPIKPDTFQVVSQQPYGASYVRPQNFDGAAAYVQASGLVVREGFWVDTDQAYKAEPISRYAAHLITTPTEAAAHYGGTVNTQGDEAYLLLVNGDGKLSVMHSAREEKMLAWVPWSTTGGASTTGTSSVGAFRAIAAAAGKIAVSVKRSINGTTNYFLEFFDEERAPLDCGKRATSTTGGTTGSFGGFTHLAGALVDVVTKGHYLGQYTVSSTGVITLSGANDPLVTEIEAGFGYEPTLKQMPVDFNLETGPVRGLKKTLVRALIDVNAITGLTIQGRDWQPTFQGDDYATESTGFTGIIEASVKGIDREGQFEIVIPKGRKGAILAVTREIDVSE